MTRNLIKTFVAMLLVLSLAIGVAASDYGNFKGQTITVAVLSGVHAVPWTAAANRFEKMTGLKVRIVEFPFDGIYDKLLTESVSRSGAFDIMELANMWVPEFVLGNFIIPLDDYLAKYDCRQDDVAPAFRKLQTVNGKTYTLILDGDVLMPHYRKDLFENPAEKAAFKKKYGYELKYPDTWDQWLDIAEFFTRDTDGDGKIDLWGNGVMLTRTFLGSTFIQLFKSYGGEFFDPDTMKPLINTEPGVKAVETLKKIMKYMPEDALAWGYTEVKDGFLHGDLAMNLNWNEIWYDTEGRSDVVGKVGYGATPGAIVDGNLVKKTLMHWGWSGVISADSKHKDAAFQFLRYVTSDPYESLEFQLSDNGYQPFRISHFKAVDKWEEKFPRAGEWLKGMLANVEQGTPDLVIPGGFEYYDSVAMHVQDALAGKVSTQVALDRAAEAWTQITKRRGVESQKTMYRSLIGLK